MRQNLKPKSSAANGETDAQNHLERRAQIGPSRHPLHTYAFQNETLREDRVVTPSSSPFPNLLPVGCINVDEVQTELDRRFPRGLVLNHDGLLQTSLPITNGIPLQRNDRLRSVNDSNQWLGQQMRRRSSGTGTNERLPEIQPETEPNPPPAQQPLGTEASPSSSIPIVIRDRDVTGSQNAVNAHPQPERTSLDGGINSQKTSQSESGPSNTPSQVPGQNSGNPRRRRKRVGEAFKKIRRPICCRRPRADE